MKQEDKTIYINVHSHSENAENEWAVMNLFPSDAEKKIQSDAKQYFSIGIHPCFIDTDNTAQLQLVEHFAGHKQIWAIGEIGLDKRSSSSLEKQIELFKKQILIAKEYNKPVIIHCVKAYSEILRIKKEMQCKTAFIFHGFRGKPELARQLIINDCYISISSHATQIPETVRTIPDHKLFIETDENANTIGTIYEEIAAIKHITKDKLLKQIKLNLNQLTKSKLISD